jgi:hypothetical protein
MTTHTHAHRPALVDNGGDALQRSLATEFWFDDERFLASFGAEEETEREEEDTQGQYGALAFGRKSMLDDALSPLTHARLGGQHTHG